MRQADAELSDLHLGVNLDNQGSVMTAIAKVKAALVALGETDIEVDLNEPSLNAAINMFEDRLDEIGHIDLRVDKESKASVQAAVAEIERELQKLAETNLKVKLDQASLEEAKRDLLAQSRQAAQATADEIQQDLDAIRIRPKLDEQKVAQVKRQLEASFEQMHNLKAQITPELDALAKRKVERDIDDLQDKIDKLKSEIEPEVSRTGVLAVLTHMAILTRNRVVDIIPKVNASAAATAAAMLKALSGARVIGDMFEHLGDVIKNLDKSAPIIGTLATAIAGLGASGIAATSNLAALSSSLASIAPTALLLPGLLGGMAVGLGVSIAAFKDFNKVVPEVKSALHGLQDTISENFWAKAAEPIRAVVDDLLPKFTAGVSKTATELGGFFGSFATNLGTSLSPALDQMFKDLSDSIGIATQGTDTFASIIATLGKVGTSYLPSLADWFVRISENFDAWLKKKGDNGLKDMIDQGIQALKDLGSILADTGGILAGFSRAATARRRIDARHPGRLPRPHPQDGGQRGLPEGHDGRLRCGPRGHAADRRHLGPGGREPVQDARLAPDHDPAAGRIDHRYGAGRHRGRAVSARHDGRHQVAVRRHPGRGDRPRPGDGPAGPGARRTPEPGRRDADQPRTAGRVHPDPALASVHPARPGDRAPDRAPR